MAQNIEEPQSAMPTLKPFPRKYRDDDVDIAEVEQSGSSMSGSGKETMTPREPKWYRNSRGKRWIEVVKIRRLGSRNADEDDQETMKRKRRKWKWIGVFLGVLTVFGVAAGITYISLVSALIKRLNPPPTNSGLQHIVESWKEPDSNGAFKFDWREDFSRDIVAKNCHSHNDYWRSVPLFQALAAGCIGVEADVWLDDNNNELRVGHSWKSTRKERTLQSLYLDPLTNIFTNRNVSVASTEERETGVFDTAPNTSVVQLIDFKSDGQKIWPVLLEQLRPLHEKGWLTYYNGTTLLPGPLTVVGTGNTPFDLVQQNSTDRFIFFDAPLDEISNPAYNSTNSYYTSVSMKKAVGYLWMNRLKSSQISTIQSQIKAAAGKGLKSRYWDTPSWPISTRDAIWFTLTDNGVGMLNVDDLVAATRWNWNWCTIAGLDLCGKA